MWSTCQQSTLQLSCGKVQGITFLPLTESMPERMHSVRPVPSTMQSYVSSILPRLGWLAAHCCTGIQSGPVRHYTQQLLVMQRAGQGRGQGCNLPSNHLFLPVCLFFGCLLSALLHTAQKGKPEGNEFSICDPSAYSVCLLCACGCPVCCLIVKTACCLLFISTAPGVHK